MSDSALVWASALVSLLEDGTGSLTVDLHGTDRDGERSAILTDDEVVEMAHLLTRIMDRLSDGAVL